MAKTVVIGDYIHVRADRIEGVSLFSSHRKPLINVRVRMMSGDNTGMDFMYGKYDEYEDHDAALAAAQGLRDHVLEAMRAA